MCDERGDCAGEQGAFDAEFTYIVECEQKLDDVIASLLAAGLRVLPEQRHIVARWLDMFSQDSPIPIRERLALLRGLLKAARLVPPRS